MEEERNTRASRRKNKSDKFQALKNLRECGSLHKPDASRLESAPIYDEVTEEEYSKRVHERLGDDFVIEDDGSGYVDDGRELFDDEPVSILKRDRRARDSTGEGNGSGKKSAKGSQRSLDRFCIKNAPTNVALSRSSASKVDISEDEISQMAAELHKQIHAAPPSVKPGCRPVHVLSRNPFGPQQQKRILSSPLRGQKPPKNHKQSFTPTKNGGLVDEIDDDFDDDFTPLSPSSPTPRQKGVSEEEEPMIISPEKSKSPPKFWTTPPKEEISKKKLMSNFTDIGTVHVKSEANGGVTDEIEVKKSESWLEETLGNSESIKGTETTVTPGRPKFDDLESLDEVVQLETDEKGQEFCKFFWLDAHEEFRNPGTIFLFGKVKTKSKPTNGDTVNGRINDAWTSTCVIVKNVERVFYVCPRPGSAFPEVYTEIKGLLHRLGISDFRAKPSTKTYSLDNPEIPHGESQFLELRYSATRPSISTGTTGDTFCHIFGCDTLPLEHFLLEHKLKGPGWLNLYGPPRLHKPSLSWCALEIVVEDPKDVSVAPIVKDTVLPPVRVCSLSFSHCSMTSSSGKGAPKSQIVVVAGLMNSRVSLDGTVPRPGSVSGTTSHFCIVAKPNDRIFPFGFKEAASSTEAKFRTEITGKEHGLLSVFLGKIQRFDPDIILGHDLCGFQLENLVSRLHELKVPNWSRLGRLKKSHQPKSHGWKGIIRDTFCGRIILDVGLSARELVRCKSYDLGQLVGEILQETRDEPLPASECFLDKQTLQDLCTGTLRDAHFALEISNRLNSLSLGVSITQIVGGVLSRTLMGGRSERNEFLLLHAFHRQGQICPDRRAFGHQKKAGRGAGPPPPHHPTGDPDSDHEDQVPQGHPGPEGSKRRKPAYTGGLVLDPKKGYYEGYVLLLDFNSLYPSIIQEYNVCFTTINMAAQTSCGEDGRDRVPPLPDVTAPVGILPKEIQKLVESRKDVKGLMKRSKLSPEERAKLDIRQLALKLTANSMYGCLGFGHSRFFARPLAALITSKGRETLMHTKELVEQKLGLEVIYGDTDSIMVNTGAESLEEALGLGRKIKGEVNSLYRKLEIDIDAVYRCLLLLKKKKYAGLRLDISGPLGGAQEVAKIREVKGLDLVRRDWAEIAKEAGNTVLDYLLTEDMSQEQVGKIHEYLSELGSNIRDNLDGMSLQKFVITKQLTKAPDAYADPKGLPHVSVALRLNENSTGRKFRPGDTMPYVICVDGTENPATQRAYHPSEIKKQGLKVDGTYYLAHQIHPVVSRLCEPIQGTSAAQIAECLGLDASAYRAVEATGGTSANEHTSFLDSMQVDLEHCEPFEFNCPKCGVLNVVSELLLLSEESEHKHKEPPRPVLDVCSNPQCAHSVLTESFPMLHNLIQLKIREYVNRYYRSSLRCDDSTCGFETRRVPLKLERTGVSAKCPRCPTGVLKLDYPEGKLLAQLSYYDKMFNFNTGIIKGTSKLSIEQLGQLNAYLKDRNKARENLQRLGHLVNHWLLKNAYSEVNLSLLFGSLLKSVKNFHINIG